MLVRMALRPISKTRSGWRLLFSSGFRGFTSLRRRIADPALGADFTDPCGFGAVGGSGDRATEAGNPRSTDAMILRSKGEAGITRSTAAKLMIPAQAHPEESEDAAVDRLLAIRPQAWPNSRMTGFADELLGRAGRLTAALTRLYAARLEAQPGYAQLMRQGNRGKEVEMGSARSREAAGLPMSFSPTWLARFGPRPPRDRASFRKWRLGLNFRFGRNAAFLPCCESVDLWACPACIDFRVARFRNTPVGCVGSAYACRDVCNALAAGVASNSL